MGGGEGKGIIVVPGFGRGEKGELRGCSPQRNVASRTPMMKKGFVD